VLGLPKTGKSALCKRMAERIGCVHLQMSKVIQGFMDGDSVESNDLRQKMLEYGHLIGDEMIVNLLQKRL
jgi:adenylate kinase family enzyme